MKVEKKLILEKIDPTGVVFESESLTYIDNDEESMMDFKFILKFGDKREYCFNKYGGYLKQLR